MEKNYYKKYFILEKEHWFFRVRRKILLYFIKKYAKSGSMVFDFGCGSGYLVGELKRLGYDAYGNDFEKEAIDYGLRHGIRNLRLSTGERIDYPDGTFDIITAFDVLEHLEHEKPTIAELVRILKPGGKIMVTVPAYKWLWGVQDEVSRHFRRYTAQSLKRVFEESNELRIVKKTYFNTFLFLPIAIVRLFSQWFNVRNRSSDFELVRGSLNIFFYHIFNLESYFLRCINFPFGVSVLLILEKNADDI